MMPRLIGFGVLAGVLAAAALAAPATADDPKAAPAANDQGWIPLFNGKDLTGWQVYGRGDGQTQLACNWRVENGVLVGSGPASSHLFTQKDDFDNFHWRVEAMINDVGNSGVYSRAQFGPGFPQGYEAQINLGDPANKVLTGSLFPSGKLKVSDEDRAKLSILKPLHKPDEWFTLELIADGPHLTIKLNGQTTVDWVDPNNTWAKGCLALQQRGANTVCKFRKIEYMPLGGEKK